MKPLHECGFLGYDGSKKILLSESSSILSEMDLAKIYDWNVFCDEVKKDRVQFFNYDDTDGPYTAYTLEEINALTSLNSDMFYDDDYWHHDVQFTGMADNESTLFWSLSKVVHYVFADLLQGITFSVKPFDKAVYDKARGLCPVLQKIAPNMFIFMCPIKTFPKLFDLVRRGDAYKGVSVNMELMCDVGNRFYENTKMPFKRPTEKDISRTVSFLEMNGISKTAFIKEGGSSPSLIKGATSSRVSNNASPVQAMQLNKKGKHKCYVLGNSEGKYFTALYDGGYYFVGKSPVEGRFLSYDEVRELLRNEKLCSCVTSILELDIETVGTYSVNEFE